MAVVGSVSSTAELQQLFSETLQLLNDMNKKKSNDTKKTKEKSTSPPSITESSIVRTFAESVNILSKTTGIKRKQQIKPKKKPPPPRPKSFIRVIFASWDLLILTTLFLFFAGYLVFFLDVYFSPNQKEKIDSINRILTETYEWTLKEWMHFNGFNAEALKREECAVETPEMFNSMLHPIDDCSMCKGLEKIDRISNIDEKTFLKKYAYTGVPVVITDQIAHWPAMHTLNFEFLKRLYTNMTDSNTKSKRKVALSNKQKMRKKNGGGGGSSMLKTFSDIVDTKKQIRDSSSLDNRDTCQFFPYKTSFHSLRHVLDEAQEKPSTEADGKPFKPWYVGWSNCNNFASKVLRGLYERPQFLPSESEMSRLDWIFMGTPGYGANIHIDDVRESSWQAQITGVKQWTFRPPAECLSKCKFNLYADVHPGDIIIFDSNRWFHATHILGDELSLTIGSEYD